MIETFRYIKKDPELILGLSLWAIIKILLLNLSLLYACLYLRLALNSPLLIFLSIVSMIISTIIIKSSQEPEIKGYFSSLLLHPFSNHRFTNGKNKDAYNSIQELIDLKSIESDHLLSHNHDLIAILEIDNGIILNKFDSSEINILLNNWQNILSSFSEIKNIKSYLFSEKNFGDTLQIFVVLGKDESKLELNPRLDYNDNYNYYSVLHQQSINDILNTNGFIAKQKFYIVLRQINQENNIHPLIKFFRKARSSSIEQYSVLQEKIKTIQEFLANYNIKSQILQEQRLKNFTYQWLPENFFDTNNFDNQFYLIDKSKYLEHKQTQSISKTYRMVRSPESGELDFWVYEFVKRAKIKSILSIHIGTRNPIKDRLNAEQKAINTKQISNFSKQSSQVIVRDNQLASSKLLEHSSSFDLSFFITVFADNLEELQKIDNQIQNPVKNCKLHGLERQQVKNYFYSLPFAYNGLSNQEKHFATIDFAKSCFAFITSKIGTESGLFMGVSSFDKKPIFLDDYDRQECNNRNFNFIGDSGSGKTVLAKLSILRSFHQESKSFYIIDSTEDGWKFFIYFLSGQVIEIDKINLPKGHSLFAPLQYQSSQDYDFNQHLEDLILFFKIIRNSDKELSAREKNFLIQSLKNLYQNIESPSLSDLYLLWQNTQDSSSSEDLSLIKDWLEIINPFCHINNGIYASLADSNTNTIQGRLILFTFSKICNDENFIRASVFLLVNFISKKIIFEKQSKTNLIIDEAWKFFVNSKSNSARDLITHLARAGRGLDLGLWTISQKPSDIPAEIHSNSSCSFIFQLKEAKDKYEISKFANLKEKEQELINSPKLNNSGTMFMKTTRSSGLVEIILDPVENILCNSTREFSNKRNKYFREFSQSFSNIEATLLTVQKALGENI